MMIIDHKMMRTRMILMRSTIQGVVVKRTVNKDGSTEALEHVSDLGDPCHFLHKVSGDSNCDHGDIIGDDFEYHDYPG